MRITIFSLLILTLLTSGGISYNDQTSTNANPKDDNGQPDPPPEIVTLSEIPYSFYQTIIYNNLFRPLGYLMPPRSKEPYRLLGTILPPDMNIPRRSTF